MTTKLVVGLPVEKGLQTNRLPFAVDNQAFTTLINAYVWRGRVKRKRGTSLLTRFARFFNSLSTSYIPTASSTITLDGSGNGNLLSGFGLESTGSLIPGTVTITTQDATVFTDPLKNGMLSPNGTINYASGAILIASKATQTASATFDYYPGLPVMGLENFQDPSSEYPGQIDFDIKYSYVTQIFSPNLSYDVSFYKNPPSTLYNQYVQKTAVTPTSWNGQNYQQFWTVTYQGVLWATNGITVPFTTTNIGMPFNKITGISNVTPTSAQLTIPGHGLVVGDFIFVNEVTSGTGGINFQTGYIVSPAIDANNVNVKFPNASLMGTGGTGIAQYLTNRSDPTKDCIRWYDGDPTNGVALNPILNGNEGWVNFCPPLVQATGPGPNYFSIATSFSIDDLAPVIYYLVGARMIFPFKNRLLFIGPVIQSSGGSPQYLQDVVIYCQDGTSFYTASFQGDARFPTTIQSILTPGQSINSNTGETGFPAAFFEDSIGFGGFTTADLNEDALTCSPNEDSLIIGFTTNQTRLVFTGNDILPFTFYLINAELGSSSTFSAINMDRGVITRGSRGYIQTNQTGSSRIDIEIPDQVFEVNLMNNGVERFTAARDYINEWIYFTYVSNDSSSTIYEFPTQTLFYNYRDNTWAVFNESYTCYGQFSQLTGETWASIGRLYPTWADWNVPWGTSSSSTLLTPQVIAGNSQGFVLTRTQGTGEATSLFIQSFSGSTITSQDHCLNSGDFILISGCIGTISDFVNSQVFQVNVLTENTFSILPSISSGTYVGGGLITRYYIPIIQTKQFPTAWSDGRKTRIGVQRYLLSTTALGQIQLLIFLSQNSSSAYNVGPIVPDPASVNNSLLYSTTLYTCPESTNLGLTPANVNLMTPTAGQQQQLWHRVNTSLIGDTVQLGFTMSNEQMSALTVTGPATLITGVTNANPCVISSNANYVVGQLVTISGVVGMTQLNGKNFPVFATSSSTFTINIDSTAYDAYISGGISTPIAPINQTSEIELHGFCIDVSPSQMLV